MGGDWRGDRYFRGTPILRAIWYIYHVLDEISVSCKSVHAQKLGNYIPSHSETWLKLDVIHNQRLKVSMVVEKANLTKLQGQCGSPNIGFCAAKCSSYHSTQREFCGNLGDKKSIGNAGRTRTGLPDGYSQIFRWYVFGPSGFWTKAPLRYAAKFDRRGGAIQGKEGIKFCHLATLVSGSAFKSGQP